MKEEVRPIYEALKGLLSSAPLPEKAGYLFEESTWNQYHKYVDRLNDITKENFNDYKLQILPDQDWGPKISVQEYRSQLNSLIMYLYGKFFHTDPQPFSGQPDVVVNNTQNQSQTTQIIMISQIQDLIDKRLYGEKLEEKEKSFLEKVKENLPSIKTSAELIQMIIAIAKSSGMDLSQVAKTFGW